MQIVTVSIYNGLLDEVRGHPGLAQARRWAQESLGEGAILDDGQNAGDFENEVHIVQLREGQDEIRLECWLR